MLNRLKRLRAVLTPKRIFRLVLMVAGGWLLVALILGLIVHFYGLVDRTQSADVIIVLGAGSGPALTRRSIHAAKLWQQGLAPR
ncbi:MAG TPA: hypothetical protein VHO69_18405, partial [Phototrophicaceae bacterium]|nr:hypothetical protein [Phototrophicaceae bacterium]